MWATACGTRAHAAEVGIPFIGTGTGLRAEKLIAEGAAVVVSDFSESDLFLNHIDRVAQSV